MEAGKGGRWVFSKEGELSQDETILIVYYLQHL